MSNNRFGGMAKIRIKGQEAEPKWKQRLIQKALQDGTGASKELRYQCRVAQDVNAAFSEGLLLPDGTRIVPRKDSPAHFGRNADGQPYLTIGVTWDLDGADYKLTWVGERVPLKMKEVAVKHDEGKKVGATTVALRLEDAIATRVRHDLNRSGEKAPRKPAKTGPHLTKKPRHFDRICAADLVNA